MNEKIAHWPTESPATFKVTAVNIIYHMFFMINVSIFKRITVLSNNIISNSGNLLSISHCDKILLPEHNLPNIFSK